MEAARFLGCHSIRVNAQSRGTAEEQIELAADGLRRLTEYAAGHDMNAPRQLTLKSDQIQGALENLDQLMEQARIRPHIEDGQPAGISITGIKPNTIFRRMRLRNGDIITGVNGAPIESVEDAMRIFGDMSSASEVQLEIKRRGRQRTLNYKIE